MHEGRGAHDDDMIPSSLGWGALTLGGNDKSLPAMSEPKVSYNGRGTVFFVSGNLLALSGTETGGSSRLGALSVEIFFRPPQDTGGDPMICDLECSLIGLFPPL